MRRAISLAALLLIVTASACSGEPQPKQTLDEVYMPTFSRVPPPAPVAETIGTLANDWRAGGSRTISADAMSIQGLFVLVALAVLLIVGWDLTRSARSRNVELALLFASGALFFDVMRFFAVLRNPAYLRLLDWIFSAAVAVGLALMFRAVQRARGSSAAGWSPISARSPGAAGARPGLLEPVDRVRANAR